jgi:hypothetical protein
MTDMDVPQRGKAINVFFPFGVPQINTLAFDKNGNAFFLLHLEWHKPMHQVVTILLMEHVSGSRVKGRTRHLLHWPYLDDFCWRFCVLWHMPPPSYLRSIYPIGTIIHESV